MQHIDFWTLNFAFWIWHFDFETSHFNFEFWILVLNLAVRFNYFFTSHHLSSIIGMHLLYHVVPMVEDKWWEVNKVVELQWLILTLPSLRKKQWRLGDKVKSRILLGACIPWGIGGYFVICNVVSTGFGLLYSPKKNLLYHPKKTLLNEV